ncbi:MAG: glycine cleavage system protein H, partial [Fenollaria timonensis]
LDDEPALINEGPYDAWIFKIEMSDPSELDDLMDDEKYAEFAKED